MANSALDLPATPAYAKAAMIHKCLLLMAGLLTLCPISQAVDVVLTGGVALKSWEHFRGPVAHDNWWANFVRASTIHIDILLKKNPGAHITWIVYRPAYITRGREEGKDFIPMIRELAAKRNAKLVFVDTSDQAYAAINASPRGNEPITSFYYFGHSNAHAFMLDYSNTIIGSSKQFMHENDLSSKLNKNAFSPSASCRSFGCYTGMSMSGVWKKAMGIPLWGNLESTRYQPVGEGCMPMGCGRWVK